MGAFDKTLGTLLIGIVFNTFLYGLVCYQFLAYYTRKFNDPWPIRYMVHTLFVLDTFHSAVVIYMLWFFLVENYNNPAVLSIALWPLTWTPIGTAIAAVITQLFLGYRIFRLTHSMIYYVVIAAIAVPAFALGTAVGVKAIIIGVLSELPQINNIVIGWLGMQVGVDLLISVSLSIILWKAKTGVKKTDAVIHRLIRGAVQTGFFAVVFSLGDLICFLKVPETNLYGMFAIPLGRIYTNTLMDTLLSRDSLREKLNGVKDFDTTNSIFGGKLSTLRWSSKKKSATTTATTGIQLTEVEVRQDVVVLHDDNGQELDNNSYKYKRGSMHGV